MIRSKTQHVAVTKPERTPGKVRFGMLFSVRNGRRLGGFGHVGNMRNQKDFCKFGKDLTSRRRFDRVSNRGLYSNAVSI